MVEPADRCRNGHLRTELNRLAVRRKGKISYTCLICAMETRNHKKEVRKAIRAGLPPPTRSETLSKFKCSRGHRWTEANTIIESYNGKVRRKCRACDRERRALWLKENEQRIREQRKKRWRRPKRPMAPDDPRHGTLTGYNDQRCRCDDCRAAIREYQRRRKAEAARRQEVAELADGPNASVKAWWSLDSIADARYGMDRINAGSEWDDPVGVVVEERFEAG